MKTIELSHRRYRRLAEAVRRRDRCRCQICGAPSRIVDHIIPRAMGGKVLDSSNMRVLCHGCNQTKGASAMTDAQVLAARRATGSLRLPAHLDPTSRIDTSDYTRRPE